MFLPHSRQDEQSLDYAPSTHGGVIPSNYPPFRYVHPVESGFIPVQLFNDLSTPCTMTYSPRSVGKSKIAKRRFLSTTLRYSWETLWVVLPQLNMETQRPMGVSWAGFQY